jgi:hypothetical protein
MGRHDNLQNDALMNDMSQNDMSQNDNIKIMALCWDQDLHFTCEIWGAMTICRMMLN